jgi:hypothetical protein
MCGLNVQGLFLGTILWFISGSHNGNCLKGISLRIWLENLGKPCGESTQRLYINDLYGGSICSVYIVCMQTVSRGYAQKP